jgi:hypothetical protein
MFPNEHIKDKISRIVKYLFTLLFIAIICLLNCSQIESEDILSKKPSSTNSPEIQWHSLLGKGLFAQGNSIEQTNDRGYIICGTSDHQAFLIKTDENGNKLWEKKFTAEIVAFGEAVQQTSDGGYILCGSFLQGNRLGDRYLWLAKTDEYGNIIWEKFFGGDQYAWGYAVYEIPGEGYIVCGDRDEHIVLIKTDLEGNTIFDETFEDYYWAKAKTVQNNIDGGFILFGNYTKIFANTTQPTKMLMIKTDSEGNEIWHKTFSGKRDANGYSVMQTEDRGYIICGAGNPSHSDQAGIWLIKTDKNGNELWESLTYYGVGTDVDITNDNEYIACGYTIDWSIQAWLVKVDSQGNKLWDLKYKGEYLTSIYSVKQTSDGGYIACGRVNSPDSDIHNILLLKIAPDK